MGTCERRFRRPFFIKSSIFQRNRRFYYLQLFCARALLTRYFHLNSDRRDCLHNTQKNIGHSILIVVKKRFECSSKIVENLFTALVTDATGMICFH